MDELAPWELTLDQFEQLKKDDYLLVDIRTPESFQNGAVPGAVNIPKDRLLEDPGALPRDKTLVLCCIRGLVSRDAAEALRSAGFRAYNLAEGYGGWLLRRMAAQEPDAPTCESIEKSLMGRFRKNTFTQFAKAINLYRLVEPGDKIAVCVSGGKDSMLMAKLFQELKRHNKFPFELVFLLMDPGYHPANRAVIEHNARLLNIPLTVFETEIFDAVYQVDKSPCYLCARMRRGYLYSKAKSLGCNKIALGHHYDDVIETILMGMLYGAQVQTMMPKLRSTNFEGMELIRPMYLVREEAIKRWRDHNRLRFIQCACRFTDTCSSCQSDGAAVSKRTEIKDLIRRLKETNPQIETNIFRSVENVNLNTVIAYKKDGVRHSFLDHYDKSVPEPED